MRKSKKEELSRGGDIEEVSVHQNWKLDIEVISLSCRVVIILIWVSLSLAPSLLFCPL